MFWKRKSQFEIEWDQLKAEQLHDAKCAEYFPVPESALEESNTLYSNPYPTVGAWRDIILPIKPLFHIGMTLGICGSAACAPPNPSIALNQACKFRLAAMDAALEGTHVDLLVLLDKNRLSLPNPGDWMQDKEWIKKVFPDWEMENSHSLHRYTRALFLNRINTSKADFLAFKEASTVLQDFFLFETNQANSKDLNVSHFVQNVFPSIKERRDELMQRCVELRWREEYEETDNVVPDDLIEDVLRST